MTPPTNIEIITPEVLLERTRALRAQGYRLVQISGARLKENFELTYSFDLNDDLLNLRILLPFDQLKIPSISSIFRCVLLYENEIHDLLGVDVQNMAVNFQGNVYKTAVKFPLGSPKAACAVADEKPPAATTQPAPSTAAPSTATTSTAAPSKPAPVANT
jgi:ech hydrogenase subunit D